MVLKPFFHLARRSTKVFGHGYAQSLAAASQSSYATQATPLGQFKHNRSSKSGTIHHRDAYHTSTQQSNAGAKSGLPASSADGHHDVNLDAYFAAWQKRVHDDDWQQFQFSKRIGWQNSSGVQDGKAAPKEISTTESVPTVDVSDLDRSLSDSAVEDIRKTHGDAAESIALSKINEAIAQEIVDINRQSEEGRSPKSETQASAKDDLEVFQPTENVAQTSSLTARSSTPVVSQAEQTSTSSADGPIPNQFAEHIHELQRSDNYAEIPAVFEAMLRSGHVPPVRSYNALLGAAIRLPSSSYQVVPKVLDVYSDMLRRKVLPDTTTYTLLLEVLSIRALEVAESKVALKQNRMRFGGMNETEKFLLQSRETENDILEEDDSLNIAMKLFKLSTSGLQERAFSAGTYKILLNACAVNGEVDNMIRVYSHMESHSVVPFASVYPQMIKAFATSGDLRSAVECYNEYKNLAIADDNGTLALLNRADDEVYAAVVKSYLICGKESGADKFLARIIDSLEQPEAQAQRMQAIRDTITIDATVQSHLDAGRFDQALEAAQTSEVSLTIRDEALERTSIAAADNNNAKTAVAAYKAIAEVPNATLASIAMLAMHVRQGDVGSARDIWSLLSIDSNPTSNMIEPTTMYAVALAGSGSVDEGLVQARQSFNRVRSSQTTSRQIGEMTELIDEGIERIASFLTENGIVPSSHAIMSFMWAMVENGGLIPLVAEQLLAGLSAEGISTLSLRDLKLALQVEAGIVGSQSKHDVAHVSRLAYLLETAVTSRMPLDQRTTDLVEISLKKLSQERPDLVERWNSNLHHPRPQEFGKFSYVRTTPSPPKLNDNFDPYANTLDQRGSAIIVDELEKQGGSTASLNEALARFRNIRRAGRHPRYIVYAKLIAAAAKDGRLNLVNDLFAMAKQDMPPLTQYPIVRHGWASILDSMVGACLTMGNRKLAADYHQQLLDIGAAPTANTFGLYITTLKESTKTFDEATEAVKIFHRAQAEAVEPSSFLYNALIGKLGKARRIDDCLFYFAEMRSRGIRPTSVTYGTIVNALCRVSDERFAQELFDEMESMPNYKPRPAPYNSLMQFFLTTKRDSSKVLEYYQRMMSRNIQPTMHTYKLLIDTYATLEPINLAAAEGVLDSIRATGQRPEAVHYSSLIHAKGCVLHDMEGARKIFHDVISNSSMRPQACLYQALFESMVANHCVKDTGSMLKEMANQGVAMTAYIANTLIHGWAMEKDITHAKAIYDSVGKEKREPSTYEAMTRAFLTVEDRESASTVVQEMLSRGYPSAVSGKVLELLGHGVARPGSTVQSA